MKRATDKVGGSMSDGAASSGAGSKRGVFLILAGLVVTGLVAGYSWLRSLPK